MKQVLIPLLISLLFASCSPNRALRKCEKCFTQFVDTTTIIKDSIAIKFDTITHVVEVPADTSIQIIKIVCDSLGNATITNSTTTQGNRSRITSNLINNELTVQASCLAFIDSIEILNLTIEKYRSETNTVYVPKLVEAKLTWWQKFKIKYGGFAFALIGAYIGFTAISLWAKSKNPLVWLSRLKRH